MTREELAILLIGDKYYSVNDLRYNQKIGIMFSGEEFFDFLAKKDELLDERVGYMKKLPLKTFNSKHCFYVEGKYLMSLQHEYLRLLVNDYELNQSLLLDRNSEEMLISRLYSEVEGTLNIENVPTTHKRIAEIQNGESINDKNDIIVKNMLDALRFIIKEKPAFNRDNLLKLYNILSKDSLSDDQKLKEGAYYRDGEVYIGAYEGADPSVVDECMDSLFAFVNDENNIKEYDELLPYICHYYILYIHPYFDYNGRTARMVSFWLNYINRINYAPYFMSEAINENKGEYYRALTDTRNTNNDLTYFLGYIYETSIKYSFVYKNLEEIKKQLAKTGDTLTSTELVYVKKILVHNSEDCFNYKMFLGYINANMSRQGALKILNNLTRYDILQKLKNRKGETIFKLNQDMILYKYTK